jgi:hydrogenase expression/formation protein HypC
MCLAVPARIVSITGDLATIDLGGVSREASLSLTPEARVGDYVLLHAGFAIQTLDEARLPSDTRFVAGAFPPVDSRTEACTTSRGGS